MVKSAKWLVVAALVFALGLHWIVLQSVAWVSMTAEFSRALPLGQAIKKTLDGENQCSLCKFVAKGKDAERNKSGQKEVLKLDYCLSVEQAVLYPPTSFSLSAADLTSGLPRFDAPPFPPPRRGC